MRFLTSCNVLEHGIVTLICLLELSLSENRGIL